MSDRWEGICPKCEKPCTYVMRFGYIDSECHCEYRRRKEESA